MSPIAEACAYISMVMWGLLFLVKAVMFVYDLGRMDGAMEEIERTLK